MAEVFHTQFTTAGTYINTQYVCVRRACCVHYYFSNPHRQHRCISPPTQGNSLCLTLWPFLSNLPSVWLSIPQSVSLSVPLYSTALLANTLFLSGPLSLSVSHTFLVLTSTVSLLPVPLCLTLIPYLSHSQSLSVCLTLSHSLLSQSFSGSLLVPLTVSLSPSCLVLYHYLSHFQNNSVSLLPHLSHSISFSVSHSQPLSVYLTLCAILKPSLLIPLSHIQSHSPCLSRTLCLTLSLSFPHCNKDSFMLVQDKIHCSAVSVQ